MPNRAAIYIDFDNFISAMIQIGGNHGVRIARSPTVWLANLGTRCTVAGNRRWLVRRCYMNPAGFVIDYGLDAGHSGSFESFRADYVSAGFEVIDCPTLTSAGGKKPNRSERAKNAADLKLAVDVMDALHGPVHYDEFVIVSGDSDFTPLLHRLRAADRRTTILSPLTVATSYRSVADQHLGFREILALLDKSPAPTPRPAPTAEPTSSPESSPADSGHDRTEIGWEVIEAAIVRRVSEADHDLLLTHLGDAIYSQFGHDAVKRLMGQRRLGNVIRAMELPGVEIDGDTLRRLTRHAPSEPAAGSEPADGHVGSC